MTDMNFHNEMQQITAGNFPYLNQVKAIGQVWPNEGSDYLAKGFEFNTSQGNDGGSIESVTVKLKMLNQWESKNGGGMKQRFVNVKSYGPAAKQIFGMLNNAANTTQPGQGLIVGLNGEVIQTAYKTGENSKTPGVWKNDSYIQVKKEKGRDGQVPFAILGTLPIFDHGNKGGGQSNQQAPQQSYQPQQGYQQPPQAQQPQQSYSPPQQEYGVIPESPPKQSFTGNFSPPPVPAGAGSGGNFPPAGFPTGA